MKNDPPLFLLSRHGSSRERYSITLLSKGPWQGEVQTLFYEGESGLLQFDFPAASFLSYLRENMPRLEKVLSTASRVDEKDALSIPFTVHAKRSLRPVPPGAASIYTDGSCSVGGQGGWAAVILYHDGLTLFSGSEPDSSSNRMELKAAIEGIKKVNSSLPVVLFSDSRYVIQGTEHWLENWVCNGFITALNRPVKNRDLWEEMAEIKREHSLWLRQISSADDIPWHRQCHNAARHRASCS